MRHARSAARPSVECAVQREHFAFGVMLMVEVRGFCDLDPPDPGRRLHKALVSRVSHDDPDVTDAGVLMEGKGRRGQSGDPKNGQISFRVEGQSLSRHSRRRL